MDQIEHPNRGNATSLLILLGSLWLAMAIGLLYHQLTQSTSIEIRWNTETELETAGFNLYRSQSLEDEYILINNALIPSKGDALSGASYAYTDKYVEAGKTYYYLIEEIEYNATINRLDDDIFSYTVPQSAWWNMALITIIAIAGSALLIMGIRERKN